MHLGLAGGRARLSLERVAVNVMDYRSPTMRGDGCARASRAWPAVRPPTEHAAAARDPGRADRGGHSRLPLVHGGHLSLQLHPLYDAPRARCARPRGPGRLHPPPAPPAMVAAHGLEEPSMDLASWCGPSRPSSESSRLPEATAPRPARARSVLGQAEHALAQDVARGSRWCRRGCRCRAPGARRTATGPRRAPTR